MSLEFTQFDSRRMIARVSADDLDELALDNAFGNMNSLLFALNDVAGICNAQEYRPKDEKSAAVGPMMSDGSEAYRIEVQWYYGHDFAGIKSKLEKLWKVFSKNDNHTVESSKQAFYNMDGTLNYYIGAGG